MIGPAAGMSFANGARAFRHRNYRLYFGGQLVSLVGTWMQAVAQGWLILQLTGDPFLLGVVAAMQWIPVMVLGLFGGIITDALPKRQTLIVTQAIKMGLSFAMFGLVFTGRVEVWQVMALAFLGGLTNVVDMPTRQAFSVEMVGREDVGNAVALNSAMFNAARVLGPAVAGLTIGAFDISTAFLIDAISFLAVLLALLAMRDSELRTVPPIARPTSVGEVFDGLREGLSYVRRTPLVLLSILVVGLVATFGMNFQVVIPPLTEQLLHSDATGYGFLMAASGARLAGRGAVHRVLAALADRPHRRRLDPRRHRRDRARPVVGVLPVDGADVPRRAGRDRDGRHGQHDDPACGPRPPPRPDDGRLHDRVRRVHPDRWPADGLDRLSLRHRRGDGPRRGRLRDRRARRVLLGPPEPRRDRDRGPDEALEPPRRRPALRRSPPLGRRPIRGRVGR